MHDTNLYWINLKSVPKDEKTGQVIDRVDPFFSQMDNCEESNRRSTVLAKDWQ